MKDILEIQKILVLDSGKQNHENIVRKLRQLDVYSELLPYEASAEDIQQLSEMVGLIIINPENSQSKLDPAILQLGLPILALGQGALEMVQYYGGHYEEDNMASSLGLDFVDRDQGLFDHVDCSQQISLEGSYQVEELPEDFQVIAQTADSKVYGIANRSKQQYALQFHVNQLTDECGLQILKNFAFNICQAEGNWQRRNFLKLKLDSLRQEIGQDKVLLGLSGGVDSSVLGVLLHKAIGDQLVCIFIDHGLLRKNENSHGITALEQMGLNIIRIDAQEEFCQRLEGITDPNDKRKAVRDGIVEITLAEIKKIPNLKYMALGTLYSSLIEFSMNSYGLVEYYLDHEDECSMAGIAYVEPFKALFKNEVRQLGKELGMPDSILKRQPFPDAGLAVRVLGEVSREKVTILRETDAILREEIAINGLDKEFSQYFTVLPNVQSSAYEGDRRSYGHLVGIRIVKANHRDQAQVGHLPWDVLENIVARMINEVPGVSRVVYDITPKPPAMVEWE